MDILKKTLYFIQLSLIIGKIFALGPVATISWWMVFIPMYIYVGYYTGLISVGLLLRLLTIKKE